MEQALADEVLKQISSKDIVTESNKPSDIVNCLVKYKTLGSTSTPQTQEVQGKRFLYAFGVEKYKYHANANLHVCVNDAQRMARTFIDYCGVDENNVVLLTNENVTLNNVKNIFTKEIINKTQAGDIIFIYWSGHGGNYSLTTEAGDNHTECLFTYDTNLKDPVKTTISEDQFGHWVRNLGGRKIVMILDACYSGGMTSSAKSISHESFDSSSSTYKSETIPKFDEDGNKLTFSMQNNSRQIVNLSKDWKPCKFGFNTFATSKSLGQEGLYIIASSTDSQESYERDEMDYSVMTYFILQTIVKGPNTLTHKELKNNIKSQVDKYISNTRPGAQQSVVEQDDLDPAIVLKQQAE